MRPPRTATRPRAVPTTRATLTLLAALVAQLAVAGCTGDDTGTGVSTTGTNNGTTTAETTNSGTNDDGQRPVAVASASPTGEVGVEVEFFGKESFDPDGTIELYLWDFGDGFQREGADVTHAFREEGSYQVTLEVVDNDGQRDRDELLVRIEQPNAPPEAVIDAEQVAIAGEPFEVAATGSSDDVEIVAYSWDFDDGPGSGSIDGDPDDDGRAVYTYGAHGAKAVMLTVTDDEGLSDTATLDVQVLAPPQAVMTGPRSAILNEEVVLSAEQSSDPDGRIVDYRWIETTENSTIAIGEGPVLTYVFDEARSYNIAVTVTDDDGLRDTAGFKVTIDLPPNTLPVADCGESPREVVIGEAAVFDGSASSDEDGELETWTWSWGDGTPDSQGEQAAHTWDTLGVYTIALTVTDDRGDSDTAECEVNVVLPPNIPPVANCGLSDRELYVGTAGTFDGSGSVDVDGTLIDYTWDFGDGSDPEQGVALTHAFDTPGDYTVTLTVTDDRGGSDTAECTARVVLPPNVLPTADCGDVLREVEVNTPVTFDGSASTDEDGFLTTYTWDFGDGSPEQQGASVDYAFGITGRFNVTLTVTDDRGDSDSAECFVDVIPPPNVLPVADCGALPPQIETGQPITFDGSGSTDEDGTIETYSWNKGDGSMPLLGELVTTDYSQPGDYIVTLTVTDDRGGRASASCNLKVILANTPPTANCGPSVQTVFDGQPLTLSGADSFDPDGLIQSWSWTLGDGSDPVEGVTVEHTWPGVADYTVTLTVTDDRGDSDSAQCVVRVEEEPNEPPVAVLTAPTTQVAGENVIFVGRDSFDPDGTIVNYHWDFGDGTTLEGEELRQAAHPYAEAGIYVTTLTVTDDRGATDTAQRTVDITAASNLEGTYSIDPGVQYSCTDVFFGSTVINIDYDQLIFTLNNGNLVISGTTVDMTQSPAPSGDSFSATGVIAGGCTETYTISGTFTGPDTWNGTFNLSLTGSQCGLTNCTNQTFNISGTR